MADQRNLTAGIEMRTDGAVRNIEEVQEALHGVTVEAYEAEDGMARFGSEAAEGAGAAADGFRDAAEGAGTFGSAVARSMGESLRSCNSIPGAIRAGVSGGIGYAAKKADDFVRRTVTGAGKIGKAFRHPIQTIKDRMADALERAGAEVGELGGDANETEDDLERMGNAGEDAGNGIRDAIGSIAGKLVALKAGFEIVKAGAETVKNLCSALVETGIQTQAVNARFKAVFDDESVSAWAENFAAAVHRSQTEVKDFLVSNKAMYQEMGITAEAADRMSQVTTSLAYDIGAALKMDDAEALSAVQDYINGNTSALAQYGIQIDETLLKQTALDMGYGSSIEELEDAELAQVRMNTLLENSASIQKKAAEEQTGYANNIKSLKAGITDFGEKAAEKLSPVFDKITGSIMKAWPKIEPVFLKMIDYLGNGLGAALPALVDTAATALPVFADMLSQVCEAAEPVRGVIMELATTVFPPLVKSLTPVLGVMGELAGAVLPPLAKAVSKIAGTVIPPLTQAVNTLFKSVIMPLVPVIGKIADATLPLLEAGLKALSPLLNAVSPVLEVIGTVLGKVAGFLAKVAEYVSGGIGDVIDKVAGFFGGGSTEAGADIPHNASGTENFRGGMTYINEHGGEIAVLPSGSRVIPADKSRMLLENAGRGGMAMGEVRIELNVNVTGGVDEKQLEAVKETFIPLAEKISETVYRKMEEKRLERQAIQEGLA